jgi:hypothetical protein
MTGNEDVVRNHSILSLFQNYLIHVAPAPVLAWLERLHDGMFCAVKVFCGVLVLGGIAAAYVAANQAEAEMHPGLAHFQAFLASVSAGSHFADFLYVRATVCGHCILPVCRRFLMRTRQDEFDSYCPAILICTTVVK